MIVKERLFIAPKAEGYALAITIRQYSSKSHKPIDTP